MQECKAVGKKKRNFNKNDMAFADHTHTQVITLRILEGCQEI